MARSEAVVGEGNGDAGEAVAAPVAATGAVRPGARGGERLSKGLMP